LSAKDRKIKSYFVFLLLESERASLLIKRLSRSALTRLLIALGVPVFAGLCVFAFYLIVGSLLADLSSSQVRAAQSSVPLQSYVLIPGLNPFVPLLYGLLALIIAVTIHEAAHGVVAWRSGVKVEGAGIILLGFIPVGAYVRPAEEEYNSKSLRQKLNIMSAGVTANLIVALVCLALLVFLILPTVSVAQDARRGVAVYYVSKGSPANLAGIVPGDIIKAIDGYQIPNMSYLSYLEAKVFKPGENVSVLLQGGKSVNLVFEPSPINHSIAIMGIIPFDPQEELRAWTHPSTPLVYFAPASYYPSPFNSLTQNIYTSPIPAWQQISNLLFWIWWVNVNLAVFNALPMYLLDGGQFVKEVFTSLFGSKARAERATGYVSALVLGLILSLILIPRLFG